MPPRKPHTYYRSRLGKAAAARNMTMKQYLAYLHWLRLKALQGLPENVIKQILRGMPKY